MINLTAGRLKKQRHVEQRKLKLKSSLANEESYIWSIFPPVQVSQQWKVLGPSLALKTLDGQTNRMPERESATRNLPLYLVQSIVIIFIIVTNLNLLMEYFLICHCRVEKISSSNDVIHWETIDRVQLSARQALICEKDDVYTYVHSFRFPAFQHERCTLHIKWTLIYIYC